MFSPIDRDPSLTRFLFAEAAVADLEKRRQTHPHERDLERDAALTVQIAHEANLSTSQTDLGWLSWQVATSGSFPYEWVQLWRLPAVTVVYTYVENPTRYLVHKVWYDGDALAGLHVMRAMTDLAT